MAAADAEEEKGLPQTSARRSKKKRVSTGANYDGKGQKATAGVGAMPGDLMSLGRLLSVSDSSGNLLDGIFGFKETSKNGMKPDGRCAYPRGGE
jgi:hypothetical protein